MLYEVVRYRPDLEAELTALGVQYLYRGQPGGHETLRGLSDAYLRWKYECNPYIDEPLVYLALSEGRAVGMRGAYGTCWQVAGERHVLPSFGDTFVVPEHRNRGVFPRIMEYALRDLADRGYAYAINQSATPMTTLASLATGWRAVGRPVSLQRRSRLEAASYRRGGRPLRLLQRARRRTFGPRPLFAALDRTGGRVTRPDDLAAWLARSDDGRIRHVRDSEFFAWRSADPCSEQSAYALGHADDPGGACVVLRTMPGLRRATLVDWVARSPAAFAALMRRVVTRGRIPELAVWAEALDAPIRATLVELGFRDAAQGARASVLVRATDARPAAAGWRLGGVDLLDPASWEIRLAPSEREVA